MNNNGLKARSYKFSLRLIAFVDTLPNKRSIKIISDQILRSGTSIGANLYEATAASSRLEFKKYHEIALKSANETRYWLALSRDLDKTSMKEAQALLDEVTEIGNMIASGVLKLKGKK